MTLTERGRELLESTSSRPTGRSAQAFYAGIVKPRELAHDAQLYRAYLRAAERLKEKGSMVKRVVLDYELKRDYQRFLHDLKRERRRARTDADRHAADVDGVGARHDLPSSTATCIFRTFESNTSARTASGRSRTSRSSRPTTAAPMPPRRAAPASALIASTGRRRPWRAAPDAAPSPRIFEEFL